MERLSRAQQLWLVAVYGNFVNRALQLTKKYWDGVVPACGELEEIDRQTIQEFKDVKEKVEAYLEIFKFREAQKEAMTSPASVINTSLRQNLGSFGKPTLSALRPFSTSHFSSLPTSVLPSNHSCHLVVRNFVRWLTWRSITGVNLVLPTFSQTGKQLAEPELLFDKIDDEAIEAQLHKLEETKMANKAASYKAEPIKKDIPSKTWEADIRVGHIIKCEKVKKSKKLLQFTIDDGSGVEAHYP